MTEKYDRAGIEPSLAELLDDPLTRLVMRRDNVSDGELCTAIRAGRARLGLDRPAGGERLCTRNAARPVPPRQLKCA
jgi:hypothetical protein